MPTSPRVVAEKTIAGRSFRRAGSTEDDGRRRARCRSPITSRRRSRPPFQAEHAGQYQLVLDLTANEKYVDGVFDYNKCRLIFKADGEELLRREFGRQDGQSLSASSSTATGRPGRTS